MGRATAMRELNMMIQVLGRRETLKYIGLGVVGAATAPLLTACGGDAEGDEPSSGGSSVAAKTLGAFAVGTWDVKTPKDPEEGPYTVTVTDGKWKVNGRRNNQKAPKEGVWSLRGGRLTVEDWEKTGTQGSVRNVPDTIGPEIPSEIEWLWSPEGADQEKIPVGVQWNAKTKTLSFTGVDADGRNYPITAKKTA